MRKRLSTPVLGVIGTLAIVFVILGSMNYDKLPLLRNTNTINAEFNEAAGLIPGDDVRVSGASVGKVASVHIEHGVVVAKLALDGGAPTLGEQTGASIVTVTLLGKMAVQLEPKGTGALHHGAVIPVARTHSPYNINDTLGELTDKSASIDKAQLSRALDQVSSTFTDTPATIHRALNGIQALSEAVSVNDTQLQSLLGRARNVSGVLADHNAKVASLLSTGKSLLSELDARQDVVVSLLHSARTLSHQLKAVVDENAAVVKPALTKLNKVVGLLNRNRKNLQASITGLRNYATAFNEAISTGPFFDAYIQNLTSPGTLAPVLSGILR